MMRWTVSVAAIVAALLASSVPALAAPPPWYPPLEWLPAASTNFAISRGGEPIVAIVIHGTDGSYESALSWFQNPRALTSAHYVIRRDGLITQMVTEANMAFHVRGSNRGTIGIEHEFDPAHGVTYTDALYRSSATLVCAIARRYGIPIDRAHIVGHSELPNADHADPGPSWNWSYYMSLVRACAGLATVTASANVICELAGCRPRPGLDFGDVSSSVAMLQWDLVLLGYMSGNVVATGGGTFGPRTLEAVRSYQSANGVPATGFYGDLTAATLGRSIAQRPARVPTTFLTQGAQSAEVELLQTLLGQLGYMNLVTGYYGPITRDALSRFQQDSGIDPTAYGPLTRMALAARTR
jgi:peptidoglycan hydrolase-like protein with peptidoglycan-binding domain